MLKKLWSVWHQFFTKLARVSWPRVLVVLTAAIAGWSFLQGVVPEPWHDRLFGVLSFVLIFIASLMKAEKENPGKVDPVTMENTVRNAPKL